MAATGEKNTALHNNTRKTDSWWCYCAQLLLWRHSLDSAAAPSCCSHGGPI